MRAGWSALSARYASRNRRERLLIAGLLVIALPAAVLSLWVEPGWRKYRALQFELTTLRDQAQRAAATPAADPNALARTELKLLQDRLQRDQQAIGTVSRSLIAPQEMGILLERLLAGHSGVRLQVMRSLPSEPWRRPGESDGPGTGAPALYRHGIELELEGSWSALRGYLAAIEASPRRLQWGQLQLQAQEHPNLRMKLSLYTLSLESAWLQL